MKLTLQTLIDELSTICNTERPVYIYNTETSNPLEIESIDTGISDRVDINVSEKHSLPRVLLIPLDKLDELEMEIKTLKEQTLDIKKELAVKDLSFFEFMDYVNLSDDFREISIEQVHCEWYVE